MNADEALAGDSCDDTFIQSVNGPLPERDLPFESRADRTGCSTSLSLEQQDHQLAVSELRPSGYLIADTEPDRLRLEKEYEYLRRKIAATRERRLEIRKATEEISRNISEWRARKIRSDRERNAAIEKFKSAVMQHQSVILRMAFFRKLCATSDCFYIWHRGPFGTINGLRLGTEASSLPSTATIYDDDSVVSGNLGGTIGVPKNEFDLSSIVFAGSTPSDQGIGTVARKGIPDVIRVPWAEVNAALGMAALLLSTLEKKPHSGIKFLTHEIIPLGNFSKIGLMQQDGRPPVLYNLFYSEDSFQFFGKRNFNTAIDGLFRCLKDAADAVVRIDKTIVLPHKVEISSRDEVTIGGLPVGFGIDGETWTRAMKYFLTDLKWLIAFTTKNADR